MARVYISSTKVDLDGERRMVLDWLHQRGHVAAHSYVADSETVRASCVADVASCDAYIVIIGRRYGFVPPDGNPLGRSITELEYEAALEARIPIVAPKVMYVDNPALTDIDRPEVYAKLQAFRQRVDAAHRPAEIRTLAELIPSLDAALARQIPSRPLEHPEVRELMARLAMQALAKDERIATLENERAAVVREKEAALHELHAARAQLAAALSRTLYAAEAPGATPAQREAATALRAGNAAPATALLREDERDALRRAEGAPDEAAAQAERRRAAALARDRGALLARTDVNAALEAFREATDNDPADIWSWFFLGDMRVASGNLDAALGAYEAGQRQVHARLVDAPEDEAVKRDLSISHNKIGDVLLARGDGVGALLAFRTSLDIAGAMAARDPGNSEWQRDVSICHDRIGDVLMAQGDGAGAFAAFRESLDIAEALAARDPANTEWQRDLMLSYTTLAKALEATDPANALDWWRQAHRQLEAMSARSVMPPCDQAMLDFLRRKVGAA